VRYRQRVVIRGRVRMGDLMKDEYDFPTAERGRFFGQGAHLVPPVHLEPDVLEQLFVHGC
jgi:hypothetical protein